MIIRFNVLPRDVALTTKMTNRYAMIMQVTPTNHDEDFDLPPDTPTWMVIVFIVLVVIGVIGAIGKVP